MNKKGIENLTVQDCYIPEDTRIYCYKGHDITEEMCVVCGTALREEEQVGCVIKHRKIVEIRKAPDGHEYEDVSYKEVVTGHICMSCYEDLPEEGEEEAVA